MSLLVWPQGSAGGTQDQLKETCIPSCPILKLVFRRRRAIRVGKRGSLVLAVNRKCPDEESKLSDVSILRGFWESIMKNTSPTGCNRFQFRDRLHPCLSSEAPHWCNRQLVVNQVKVQFSWRTRKGKCRRCRWHLANTRLPLPRCSVWDGAAFLLALPFISYGSQFIVEIYLPCAFHADQLACLKGPLAAITWCHSHGQQKKQQQQIEQCVCVG